MKVNRAKLLQSLEVMIPGLSKKVSIVPSLSHLYFLGDSMCFYNERVYISYPFQTEFKCSCDLDMFYRVIQKLTGDEIDLDYVGVELVLRGGKERAGLATGSIETFSTQDLSILSTIDWKPLPQDFKRGLELCLFSVARDATQRELTCIYVSGNRVCSSDDCRISLYEMSGTMEPVLIPESVASVLVGYELEQYHIENSWFYVKEGDGFLAFRPYSGDYHEVDEFFVVEGTKVQFPNDFVSVVKDTFVVQSSQSASVLSQLDSKMLVKLKESVLSCRMERDMIWFEKDVDLPAPVAHEAEFTIDPNFFKSVLEVSNEMVLGADRALFTFENFRHVVALLPVGV